MKILIVKKIKSDLHSTVTLAGRLFNHFNNNGHDCYLTKFNEEKLIDTFGFRQKLIPVSEWNVSKFASHYRSLEFDVIYCLTTDDAVIGCQLQELFFKAAKLFIGVYHPRQFFVPTYFLPNYKEYLNKKLISRISPQNLIFMDDACKKSHMAYYNEDFEDAPIVPLPMNIAGHRLSEKYIKNKVVSVGRLTRFKRYPIGVMRAMHRLKQNNALHFQYHIIGAGSEFKRIKKWAAELKLENDVIFHGTVPYDKINDIIKDAYCFIGMGTTVGEAAGIGLPSLVAIIDQEDHSYGFLGRLPHNIVGEPGEDIEPINYLTSFEAIYKMSETEYATEQKLSIEQASFYSIENIAGLFIKAFEKGKNWKLKISFFSNIFYLLSKIQLKFFIKKEYRHK